MTFSHLAIQLALLLSTAVPSLPLLSQFDQPPFTRRDADAIVAQLAAANETPWLIRAIPPTVSPGNTTLNPPGAVAYLLPTVSTPRFRLGPAIDLYAHLRDSPPKQVSWRIAGRFRYAQVSLREALFGAIYSLPGPVDCPFQVSDGVGNYDIVSIVDLVRSSPMVTEFTDHLLRPSTITAGAKVRGRDPIVSLDILNDGSIEVHTAMGDYGGQVITVRKVEATWKVTAVGRWVI